MTSILAMFGLPGYAELLVVGFLALLFFGRRLPEVARSVGSSIVEFKRGIQDTTRDIDTAVRNDPRQNRLEHGGSNQLPEENPTGAVSQNNRSAGQPYGGSTESPAQQEKTPADTQ